MKSNRGSRSISHNSVNRAGALRAILIGNNPNLIVGEMNSHSTDRFIGGAITSAIVTAAVVVILRYLDVPSGRYQNVVIQAAAPLLVAACILFPRPLLFRTVLRSQRNPLLLDEDLNATLTGRAIGLIGGFFIGISLSMEAF